LKSFPLTEFLKKLTDKNTEASKLQDGDGVEVLVPEVEPETSKKHMDEVEASNLEGIDASQNNPDEENQDKAPSRKRKAQPPDSQYFGLSFMR